MSASVLFKRTKRTTLAGQASVDFTLKDNPLYMVDVCSLVPGTDNVSLRQSFNAFAAGYKWHVGLPSSAASTYAASVNSSSPYIAHVGSAGNGVGESFNSQIFIPNAASPTLYKPVWSASHSVDRLANCTHNTVAGYYGAGTDALPSTTFVPSTGTLATGNMDLWQLALHKASDVNKTFGNVKLLARTEAAGESFLDFTLSGRYNRYFLVKLGVVPSVDGASLYSRAGTSGGVQMSGYARHHNLSKSSTSAYGADSSASSGLLSNSTFTGNVSGENFCQIVEIPNPTGWYKIISTQGAYIDNGGNAKMCNGSGSWKGGTDQLVTYRVLPASGEIDEGLFLLFGVDEIIDIESQFVLQDTNELSSAPYAEFAVESGIDEMKLIWDLTTSVDDVTLELSWEIDGTWYTQNAQHKNTSYNSAATYDGNTLAKVANVGSGTGEGASQTLSMSGLQSTSLYPTALLGGGNLDPGNLRMSQGALARKTAGTITGIRLTPLTGTISGRASAFKKVTV